MNILEERKDYTIYYQITPLVLFGYDPEPSPNLVLHLHLECKKSSHYSHMLVDSYDINEISHKKLKQEVKKLLKRAKNE